MASKEIICPYIVIYLCLPTSYVKGDRKPTFEVVKRISEYLKVNEMFFTHQGQNYLLEM